jgi:serine/threonine protein kinase
MPLATGTRLGPYEILAPIGAGGMGEVYKAKDTRLDRTVAIKVLASHLSQNPGVKQRFEREARAISALSHSHICALYDVGSDAGVDYLVMELVDGPTLEEFMAGHGHAAPSVASGGGARRALAIDDALSIAKQIAEALQAAHDAGIIHRDLKPANVKVRADGTVKVLDFGLAKAMEPESAASPNVSQSPTMTSPAMPFDWRSGHPEQRRGVTQAGMILGTAAYMSPEQARGTTVDKRADIWAFGVVLYEMLTGRRAGAVLQERQSDDGR